MKRTAILLALAVGIALMSAVAGGAGAIAWYRDKHPPTVTIHRAPPMPATAPVAWQCPVTPRLIEEYYRGCRARARSDATKPRDTR